VNSGVAYYDDIEISSTFIFTRHTVLTLLVILACCITIAEPIIKRDFSHIIPGTDIFYIIILEEILYRGTKFPQEYNTHLTASFPGQPG